jgi:hypothetical protein
VSKVTLETLLEQTEFLLGKQKEAKKDCVEIFSGLRDEVGKKLEQVKGQPENLEALNKIYTIISQQVERIEEDSQADIDFLGEQLRALREIEQIKDKKKSQEVLKQIVDENEEFKETEEFKKEVSEEAALSRQNLMVLVGDIRDAINEGSAKDVALYLESILGEEEGESDEEDEECDDECCGGSCREEESSCGGCRRSGGSCCEDECLDLFAEISKPEKNKKNK